MLFNSFEFLVFLPVVFCLYWFLFQKKLVLQNALILFASYFFYGWWSWQFMGLLILSTILDYTYGFWVASPNRKKAKLFLWLSVINNLGILAIFKYYNFFASQFQQGFDTLGLHFDVYLLQIALPVGISFYTFHGMSYVFDIYRSQQKPVKNLIDYAVFVSFFPLLVAGPIERANHLLPQVQKPRKFNYAQSVEGLRLILWGLFKKVVIADNSAYFANQILNNLELYEGSTLLLGALFFTLQIYGDFSGYSDIALGTARLFGFTLLDNFKFPYLSRSIGEFWKRWHISLSSWFRDYLYIPLGGSKNGLARTIRNTFIIFIVSGFWHGASWNFIFWGGFHAIAFIPGLLLPKRTQTYVIAQNSLLPSFKELLQCGGTMLLVVLSWVLFRLTELNDIKYFFTHLFAFDFQYITSLSNADKLSLMHLAFSTLVLFSLEWLSRKSNLSTHFFNVIQRKLVRYGLYILLFFMIIYLIGDPVQFIYFAF
jgi:D-alanyl-lipoteichoic acid acyltransferase DltB (MBOAT superfamily)